MHVSIRLKKCAALWNDVEDPSSNPLAQDLAAELEDLSVRISE